MTFYASFTRAMAGLTIAMKNESTTFKPANWQSIDVSAKPEAEMRELIHVDFRVLLPKTDLEHYRQDIQPNLPWADHHFLQERVSGQPINPGWTWKTWPWGNSADKFRREGEQFSHSYAERYWPKYAGFLNDVGGAIPDDFELSRVEANRGVRYQYGDLNDVIDLLVRDPGTRQAWLPVWFPEDTGVAHGERVPCTLGYHFLRRHDSLHIYYPIRSCDFTRHLRDDLYLTVRLLLWVLEQCQQRDPENWSKVRPGMFSFWAGSLHCFINDYRKLFGST